jgi:hypothetical protein
MGSQVSCPRAQGSPEKHRHPPQRKRRCPTRALRCLRGAGCALPAKADQMCFTLFVPLKSVFQKGLQMPVCILNRFCLAPAHFAGMLIRGSQMSINFAHAATLHQQGGSGSIQPVLSNLEISVVIAQVLPGRAREPRLGGAHCHHGSWRLRARECVRPGHQHRRERRRALRLQAAILQGAGLLDACCLVIAEHESVAVSEPLSLVQCELCCEGRFSLCASVRYRRRARCHPAG